MWARRPGGRALRRAYRSSDHHELLSLPVQRRCLPARPPLLSLCAGIGMRGYLRMSIAGVMSGWCGPHPFVAGIAGCSSAGGCIGRRPGALLGRASRVAPGGPRVAISVALPGPSPSSLLSRTGVGRASHPALLYLVHARRMLGGLLTSSRLIVIGGFPGSASGNGAEGADRREPPRPADAPGRGPYCCRWMERSRARSRPGAPASPAVPAAVLGLDTAGRRTRRVPSRNRGAGLPDWRGPGARPHPRAVTLSVLLHGAGVGRSPRCHPDPLLRNSMDCGRSPGCSASGLVYLRGHLYRAAGFGDGIDVWSRCADMVSALSSPSSAARGTRSANARRAGRFKTVRAATCCRVDQRDAGGRGKALPEGICGG